MGTLDLVDIRRDNAGLTTTPVVRLPPGCKGRACPAFALCQGRCEPRRKGGDEEGISRRRRS